jgi:hypothetical protein
MNVEEVKRLRLQLETEISKLVNAFQSTTSLTVVSLGLEHFCTDADIVPVNTQVKADVRLEWS